MRSSRTSSSAAGGTAPARSVPQFECFEVVIPEHATALDAGVPERTVRSWRERFRARSSELSRVLGALAIEWGGRSPLRTRNASRPGGWAIDAMSLVWHGATRRPSADVPPPWRLANVIVGGELIATRVSLPFPVITRLIARSRAP